MTAAGTKASLIPKENKKAIYSTLFKDGVLVVKKDSTQAKHDYLDLPNLHVMMTLKSLLSRNLVTETYNWRHHYYVLSAEGIEYVRDYLHLPAQTLPDTFTQKTGAGRGPRREGGRGMGRGPRREERRDE